MRVFSLLALALLCGSATAESEKSLTYKGLATGANKAEFSKTLPLYQCGGGTCDYSEKICRQNSRAPVSPEYGSHIVQCEKGTSFGGVYVTRGVVKFKNDKLGMVLLSLPSEKMNALLQATVLAYGPPVSADDAPFQTRAGATLPNWSKTWRVGSDNLTVKFRFGTIDEGVVILTSDAWIELEKAANAAKATGGAKDF